MPLRLLHLEAYLPHSLQLLAVVWVKGSLLVLLNAVEHVERTGGSAQAFSMRTGQVGEVCRRRIERSSE